MNNDLKMFLDDIVDRGPQIDYWFMTKQSIKIDFILYVAQIIDRYQMSGKTMDFATFYKKQFNDNPDMKAKYPNQISDNTFRNAIICEYLGLSYRTSSQYKDDYVTEAYEMISKYIKTAEDLEIYHELIERQIEKLAFNVLPGNERYGEVTVFAIMLLYKILYELYKRTGSSKISYNEFIIFVMRTKKYSDWEKCLNLIEESRKVEDFDKSEYIDKIVKQIYVDDIRFDELFPELPHIKYISDQSFEIADDESVIYIKNVIDKFENSRYCEISEKKEVREFLCSSEYFDGSLDHDLDINNINNQISLDKLDETVEEEIKEERAIKKNPRKVRNVDNTTSIQIIEFPDETYKKKPNFDSAPTVKLYNFEKINKRKAKNGKKAEELVVDYEKLKLAKLGYTNLVNMVEQVSKTKGDGLGYDVFSFDIIDGNPVPIYIEVKGTTMNENSPFDITRNELDVAKIHGKSYKIYRISSLGDNIANCFIIDGDQLLNSMELVPMSFKVFKKDEEE